MNGIHPPPVSPTPSLRVRLWRHVMLPLALAWLIGTVATLGVASHFTERAFDRGLLDDAYAIAEHLTAQADGSVTLAITPGELEAALFDQAEFVHYAVLRPDGSTLAGTPLPTLRPPLPGQRFRYGNALRDGRVVRGVVLRHDLDDRAFHVVVAHTTRIRNELLHQLLLYGALPLLLLLSLLAWAIWRSISRDLAPLARLQTTLARRDVQDLTPVAIAPSTREIEQLGHAVNGLFDRLGRSVRAQHEFAGNVAHELRTPLARIRALADYGLAHPEAAVTREQLRQIAGSAERAGRLVHQLLDLARADEAALALKPQRLALAPLVGQAVLRHIDRADALGVDLGARGLDDGEEAVQVMADAVLIEGILDNLIDNALRHGGRTLTIELGLDRAGGHCELAVVDDGPGMDPAARGELVKRWSQGGERSGERVGAGLGLSIVARYAQLLGSRLRLDAGEHGRGLRASLRLPLA